MSTDFPARQIPLVLHARTAQTTDEGVLEILRAAISDAGDSNWLRVTSAKQEPTEAVAPQRPERLTGGISRQYPDGGNFPWGPIDAIHEFGPYTIIEYRKDQSRTGQSEYWHLHGRSMFMVWDAPDGRSTRSYYSFDEAVLGAVALRRDGVNTQADRFMARMLGIETTEV